MALNVSITSTIHIDGMTARIEKALNSTAVSNEAKRLMDQYVPFDEGILAGSAYAEPGAVVYPAVYAVYPYEKNFNFKKDRHDKATNKWDKASIGDNCTGPEGGKFLRAVAGIVNKELG